MTDRPEPALGAGATAPGVVHLGAGAFARGHVWWATALAADAEPGPWGVVAVARRSARVVEALRARHWRYRLRLVDRDTDRTDTVGVVHDGLVAADEPGRLATILAAPDVHVVSVTMTEAAYTADGDLPSLLVAAARDRLAAGAPAPSVVVCDNVLDGGPLLRGLCVDRALTAGLDDVAAELTDRWAFPLSVVDRVVPSVDEATEPDVVADATFRWVLEDAVAGPRPAWEAAGVRVVDDAVPFQLAKLHLVNAPHSLLAYLGATRGHTTVADAMGDPLVEAAVTAMLRDELVGCVPAAPGLDPADEAATTVRRFAEQVVPHALTQVAAEGSTKLPQRLARPFARLRSGDAADARWTTLVVALWADAVDRDTVDDTRADEVGSTAGSPPAERARALLDLLGLGVPDHADPVRDRLTSWLDLLARHGPRGVHHHLSTAQEETSWT